MEISDPVPQMVITLTVGRKQVPVTLTSRAQCRALIRAAALAMAGLPDDGEGGVLFPAPEEPEDGGQAEASGVTGDGCGAQHPGGFVCTHHAGGQHEARGPEREICATWPIELDADGAPEPACECAHSAPRHPDGGPCLAKYCGCQRYRPRAPRRVQEPPVVVRGEVEPLEPHEARVLAAVTTLPAVNP